MRQDSEAQFDETFVREILAEAEQRRPRSRGQFDLFSRPYLAAGYAREVAEAERRYFKA
jgi:hypothetical protein